VVIEVVHRTPSFKSDEPKELTTTVESESALSLNVEEKFGHLVIRNYEDKRDEAIFTAGTWLYARILPEPDEEVPVDYTS
jgi:hypothetical protein